MNAPDSSPPPSCCSGSPSCTAALVLGIIALVLALIGFFPCLGWITLIPAALLAIIALPLIAALFIPNQSSSEGQIVINKPKQQAKATVKVIPTNRFFKKMGNQ